MLSSLCITLCGLLLPNIHGFCSLVFENVEGVLDMFFCRPLSSNCHPHAVNSVDFRLDKHDIAPQRQSRLVNSIQLVQWLQLVTPGFRCNPKHAQGEWGLRHELKISGALDKSNKEFVKVDPLTAKSDWFPEIRWTYDLPCVCDSGILRHHMTWGQTTPSKIGIAGQERDASFDTQSHFLEGLRLDIIFWWEWQHTCVSLSGSQVRRSDVQGFGKVIPVSDPKPRAIKVD